MSRIVETASWLGKRNTPITRHEFKTRTRFYALASRSRLLARPMQTFCLSISIRIQQDFHGNYWRTQQSQQKDWCVSVVIRVWLAGKRSQNGWSVSRSQPVKTIGSELARRACCGARKSEGTIFADDTSNRSNGGLQGKSGINGCHESRNEWTVRIGRQIVSRHWSDAVWGGQSQRVGGDYWDRCSQN